MLCMDCIICEEPEKKNCHSSHLVSDACHILARTEINSVKPIMYLGKNFGLPDDWRFLGSKNELYLHMICMVIYTMHLVVLIHNFKFHGQ